MYAERIYVSRKQRFFRMLPPVNGENARRRHLYMAVVYKIMINQNPNNKQPKNVFYLFDIP